jgi:hypothetical protein
VVFSQLEDLGHHAPEDYYLSFQRGPPHQQIISSRDMAHRGDFLHLQVEVEVLQRLEPFKQMRLVLGQERQRSKSSRRPRLFVQW